MNPRFYILNKALLEIRSSFIISPSFYFRFWFALGSVLAAGSIFGFWTLTFAPYPGSSQVRIFKNIARLKAPIFHQLNNDYVKAMEAEDFYRIGRLQNIIQGYRQGQAVVTKLYFLEKQSARKTLENMLYRRARNNFFISVLIFALSPFCFIEGFYLLRKHLRDNGYTFHGRLLFFRIATPSVFKLAGLLSWGCLGILSYQVWTPSYWLDSSIKIPVTFSQESPEFPLLSQEKLALLNLKQQKEILREYWVKSVLFYGFFGGIFWILGRRWDQLPLKRIV
ncbi:hypothetical protein [Holospora undulata]|uniref:Uncharacterized protein n=1 Tax=Holospora undulata HU1 TaxID=1321371 RepID=A0A061JI08_9PROT|nr:hypothetical protein [Holospora undulata]ETZ04604.1 hypothetical protein K737_300983 [Holospora undulata HU1]